MRVSTMRRVDALAGVPLCGFLTLVSRLFGRRGRARKDGLPPRVAVIKLAEQGAIILALPSLRRLAERLGRENIYFVAFEESLPILVTLDILPPGNIIPLPSRGVFPFARGLWRAVRRLRSLGPLATLDLEFYARVTAAVAFLGGATVRVGFGGGIGDPYRGRLLTREVPFDQQTHVADSFARLTAALLGEEEAGAKAGALPPFTPTGEDRQRAQALLARFPGGAPGDPLILLNPNAGDLLPQRRWPGERFVELARLLLDLYPDASIAFCGAPGEAAAVGAMAARAGSPRCLSLAGRTTLRDLLALFAQADLLVTNDSGPAHFASLAATPTVVLFGPETPVLFAPLGERVTVLAAGAACSPCVSPRRQRKSACRENLCMEAIGVEEVLKACREALARRRREPAP